MDSLQEYLEKRILDCVQNHAAGQVEMTYDVEDCDLPMRFNDYKGETIEKTIDNIILIAMEFLLENDIMTPNLVTFNKDKIVELARDLVKNDQPVQAYLAQCALLLRGYQVGAKSMGLLAHHVGKQFREN